MTTLSTTDQIFFERAGLDRDRVTRLVGEALGGVDDGELFLEYCQSEGISFDDGRIRRSPCSPRMSSKVCAVQSSRSALQRLVPQAPADVRQPLATAGAAESCCVQ